MTSLMLLVAANEQQGIFPTCDTFGYESPAERRPACNAPSRESRAAASEREKAELSRIALAEEAWRHQIAMDDVDEASMESFPCSDPPGYYPVHA